MKKILILLLLTVATVLPTFAVNWVQISDKAYIDTDSIEPYVDDFGNIKANQYCYWEKRLNDGSNYYKETEKDYNRKIWYIKSKGVIDINKKTFAPKYAVLYDLKENIIDTYRFKDSELSWTDIIPDTVGYEVLYVVKTVMNRE